MRVSPRTIRFLLSLIALAALAATADAQTPDVHYWQDAESPPGAIAQTRLARGGPVMNYYQPVEIRAPEGVHLSYAQGQVFSQPKREKLLTGMLIGPVYRLRASHIPFFEGQAVYPTIEVIDRLYPPNGQEARFPIIVELAMEDIRDALAGKFVTRVVYLEEPQAARPIRGDVGGQHWHDLAPGRDPLAAADSLGRPVAIVRLGGRVPTNGDSMLDMDFTYGSPPVVSYRPPTQFAETATAPTPNVARAQQPMPRPNPATARRPAAPGPSY